MSDKNEHWIKNPWVVGIALLILTPPFSGVWDWIRGIPFLTTLTLIWDWFVNCKLKLWWILLYIIITSLISTIRLHYKNQKLSHKAKNHIPRTYLRFTAIKFGNYNWRWEWVQDTLTKDIDLANLAPVCPTASCDNNALSISRKEIKKERGFSTEAIIHRCDCCDKEYRVGIWDQNVLEEIRKRIREDTFLETTTDLPYFIRKNMQLF